MKTKAFTLIELLIVVAIIAILAAIAVPNFLEAQTRSKVSRVKSDMRTMAMAAESYMVDHNTYPPNYYQTGRGTAQAMDDNQLTTPIAYMTSIPRDGFRLEKNGGFCWYCGGYDRINGGQWQNKNGKFNDYTFWSYGPDRDYDVGSYRAYKDVLAYEFDLTATNSRLGSVYNGPRYDPSNGTVSNGDILRFGNENAPQWRL